MYTISASLLSIVAQSLQSFNEPLFPVFGPGGAQAFICLEKIDRIARNDHSDEGFENKSWGSVLPAAPEQDGFPVELVDDAVEGGPGCGEDGQLDSFFLAML